MNMNQFLISLAFNFLSNTLPLGLAIYFAIRLAISHGELSIRRRINIKEDKNVYERMQNLNVQS